MARYVVELEPMPGDGRPDAVRLKQALKYLGRACRLRCVGIRSEEPIKENQAAASGQDVGCPKTKEDTDDSTTRTDS